MTTAASRLARDHARHRAARARVVDAMRRVPPERWLAPRAPGKWSPAEICEHLSLADEAALRELAGDGPMRTVLPTWKLALFRWTVLRWIHLTGRFPPRAPAPRETRPSAVEPDQSRAVERLAAGGARLEAAIEAAEQRGGATFTHPYFGTLGARPALRLVARHLAHHARQVEERGE